MIKLFGREYTKKELLMYSGNFSNFAGITKTEFSEGKMKGVSALEVKTGSGLEYTLIPDKCLDIFALRYKGVTLSQQAKNGLTGPLYGQGVPGQFPRTVSGGMMFTSGLLNAGPESVEEDGTFHQTHGNIGVTPAENLCASARWDGDDYVIEASGTMRESALFKHNLMLTRHITTKLGANELCIQDTLENLTGNAEEFCLLYHFNFGFPFLTEALKLKFPKNKCIPRTPEARDGLALADTITRPEHDFFEHVFFRELEADENGICRVEVENPELGIGAYIAYEQKNLPVLCEWKSMRASDYTLGIEPANMYIMGRKEERINGTIKRIKGYEKLEFNLKFGVYDL
jgi:hypothetical protein